MAVYQTGDAGVVTALEATNAFRSELVRHRERAATHGRRGWLMRRALVTADALGLAMAFAISSVSFPTDTGDRIGPSGEILLFLLTLPMWLLLAKLQGLYERDEERTDHSTIDEIAGVLVIVTLGTWFFQALSWMTGLASPQLGRLVAFWLLAVVLVTTGRAVARTLTRRSSGYAMRTIVVGAGEIGQLVARKIGLAPRIPARSRRLRRRPAAREPGRDARRGDPRRARGPPGARRRASDRPCHRRVLERARQPRRWTSSGRCATAT